MDPSYAAVYRDLYERHWWWRAREHFLLGHLEREARWRTDLRILDVGCGDALFFDRLSEFGTVRGVEPDIKLLSDGPWRSSIHAGTLETFEAEEPFDWILMLDVIEHIAEPEATLERARELAAPGAQLFVTVPAFPALWTRHDDLNQHFARYDAPSLEALLTRSGWAVAESRYFFHWLVPLKLATRLRERLVRGAPQLEAVPTKLLNEFARTLSIIEQQLTAQFRLPFGTSLYARCGMGSAETWDE